MALANNNIQELLKPNTEIFTVGQEDVRKRNKCRLSGNVRAYKLLYISP